VSVALLAAEPRLVLLAVLLTAGVAAGMLAWRRTHPGPAIACAAVAAVAVVVLAADRAVGVVARSAMAGGEAFNEHQLTMLSPWGPFALAAGVAAAAAVVILGAMASRRVSSPWRRAVLIGLRAGAALVALTLFLEPAIELREVAREPNRVVVLIDDSRSMSLRDEPGGPTRLERAREVLERSQPTFSAWRARHDLDVYHFSDDLERVSPDAAATGDAEGEATRLRRALEGVRAAYEGADLAGIVLISDGITTDDLEGGADTGAARLLLRSLDAPVHTVWAGRPGLRDVSIARLLVDELAFVRTVVPVEVVVRSTGYGPRRIPVTLSKEGAPIRRAWVDLDAGDTEARVRFEFTPTQTGTFAYEVSTPVADDEAVTTNNARSFVVRVIRDKVRVLQVAGRPSWDVRALRSMLKANPNVDLISFFILRTQDDVSMVPNEELSLIPFPTHELFQDELPSFDVIVLQNFNFAPYRLGRYLENIRRFVEGGGALVMLGGELSFASGDYRGTPVADALPVVIPPRAGTSPLLDERPFSPQLTREGASHPVTSLRHDPADNRAAWSSLPELYGVNLVLGAQPDGTVLAVHPRLRAPDGERMPVIVAGEHGEGRALAITTDSLWRWDFVAAGTPGSERRYDEFWRNALRWLIRDPDLQYLRVSASQSAYAPGEAAELAASVRDRGYQPIAGAEIAIIVEREGFDGARERLLDERITTDEEGLARQQLAELAPGLYRVDARAAITGEVLQAQDRFLVGSTPRELERPAADESLLEHIARETGGEHLGPAARIPPNLAFREPRIVRVDTRTEVELWSRPALFILALIFLGLEWGLRQKLGTR
jgi:uncharacterized membrane protein